jgi:hypothetical protein
MEQALPVVAGKYIREFSQIVYDDAPPAKLNRWGRLKSGWENYLLYERLELGKNILVCIGLGPGAWRSAQ